MNYRDGVFFPLQRRGVKLVVPTGWQCPASHSTGSSRSAISRVAAGGVGGRPLSTAISDRRDRYTLVDHPGMV